MKKYISIGACFVMLLFIIPQRTTAQTVTPVKDKKHRKWSRILQEVEQASMFIHNTVMPIVEGIKNVQNFVAKASTIVNGVIKNMKMIRALIDIEKDIREMVEKSIDIITAPRDTDGDGEDDLKFLDKWKHIQILLKIAGEADSVFELFKNVIEEDGTIMDDKGRLTLIREAYRDAVRIKASIKLQIRRLNKEIYKYRRQKKEIETFANLFSGN